MHLIIEIIGDDSPDADRLMKALRETVSFWGKTEKEQYTRHGAVEKTVIEFAAPTEPDEGMVRFEGDTAEGGKIVLCKYPEGFILRHHGEVVWREWACDK